MFRQRNARAQAARFTPTSAALYANYARDYPWMQPGVIRAASMAGYYPNNPDMVRVAAASLAEGYATGRVGRGTRQRASYQNPGQPNHSVDAPDYLPSNNRVPEGRDDPLAEFKAAGMVDGDGNIVRTTRGKVYKGRENGKAVWEYESEDDRQADHMFRRLLNLVRDSQGNNRPIPFMDDSGDWFQFHPKTGATERLTQADIQGAIRNAPIEMAGSVPFLGKAIEGVESVVEPVYQAAQPTLRTAGMVANYPIQEFQSFGRNIKIAVDEVQDKGLGSLFAPAPEEMKWGGEATDIGIALEQLVEDPRNVDTGSGFFVSPTSQVARERVAREAEAGQIGGHNITWGRWIASSITEPDSVPFDVMSGFVDFSIQLADPTSAGLGQAGRARQASKLFEAEQVIDPAAAAGLLGRLGRKPTVDFNTAQKVFDSPRGARAIEDLTTTTSAYQVGKKLSRQGMDFLHDPALYDDIAKTGTTAETRAILDDAINTGKIREVADLTQSWGHGLSQAVKSRMPRSKLFDKMPGIGLHLTDPKQVVNEISRHFRNVDAPEEAVEEAFNKLAAARTKSGRRNAVMEVFGQGPNSLLAHYDIDPDVANEMLRLYKTSFNEMWRGLVDELGVEVPTWEHVLANGEKTLVGGPHAMIELIEDWMPLPDARKLRELTSRYPHLLQKLPDGPVKPVLELPGAAVDYFMQEVWKPLALFRAAWLVRVLGEGQIRIAASGMDSLFSGHPLEALGFMFSKKHFGVEPRVPTDIKGREWKEVREFENSLSNIHNWAHRPGATQHVTDTTLYEKGRGHDAEYRHAVARQLLKFHYDPVYSKWMQADSLDEAMEWFTKKEGREYLHEYQEAFPGNMETPEQIRKFFDDIDLRFDIHTSGNTDLFDIIRNGEWTDDAGETHSIYRGGDPHFTGNPEVNPEFTKLLSSYMDDLPKRVVGQKVASTRGKSDYPTLKRWVVQNLLYGAMSYTENILARSQVYKQHYARELSDMIQFGADEIVDAVTGKVTRPRDELIAKAEELRVPNRTIKHMRHLASTKKAGKMNLDEMDIIAKGKAMDRTQKLLYSYSERRQVFDIARNFIPFGDAWWEVLTTWGRIMGESGGKPLRRGQQIIEGSINSGFFHENRFGELAFTYPFSGALTQALTGTPIEMEGRVQGLSMFGEIMPGLGPVAQIPAAWLLKDKPEYESLNEFLLPYGAPEGMDIINPKTYMPGWMKTAFSLAGFRSVDDNRLWENHVGQHVDYLFSTGEYGMTPSEQTRLWQDARDAAKKTYGIRAIAQFFAPAAPSLDWYVDDKSGTRLSAIALAEEFHNSDEEDFDTSVQKFVDKYGVEAIGALVASSAVSIPGFPDSLEGQAWLNENPDIKGKYPLIYALFAPEGEFNIEVYSNQFHSGDRQALTARQHTAMLSDWLNRYWRSKAMQDMGVANYSEMNQQQRNAWEDITELIDTEYPSAVTGIVEKPEVEDMVKQLEQAATDEAILRTPAGPALTQYLELRREADQLVDRLADEGVIDSQTKGFTKSKATRPIREVLRSQAQALIDENPAFRPLWEHVFSRELIKE